MILPIRRYGDPVLRRKARTVTSFDDALARLASDMIDTMIEADGLGLAAPQVGVSTRVFVVAGVADPEQPPGDDDEAPSLEAQRASALVFVNPSLIERSGEQHGIEGCLSIPGLYHESVARAASLRVRFQDLNGMWHERRAEGRFAVVLQHEADHLEGVLFLDRLDSEERRSFMDEHRGALAEMQREAKAALRDAARAS